jgi:hypothetical protein
MLFTRTSTGGNFWRMSKKNWEHKCTKWKKDQLDSHWGVMWKKTCGRHMQEYVVIMHQFLRLMLFIYIHPVVHRANNSANIPTFFLKQWYQQRDWITTYSYAQRINMHWAADHLHQRAYPSRGKSLADCSLVYRCPSFNFLCYKHIIEKT